MKAICGADKMPAARRGLWFCTREPKHEGPCAMVAIPAVPADAITAGLVKILDDMTSDPRHLHTRDGRSVSVELMAKLALAGIDLKVSPVDITQDGDETLGVFVGWATLVQFAGMLNQLEVGQVVNMPMVTEAGRILAKLDRLAALAVIR